MTKSIPFKLPPYEEDASHVMWTRYLLQGEAVLKGDVEALSTPGADVEIISPMIDHIMTLGFAIQRCRNFFSQGSHEDFQPDRPDLLDEPLHPATEERTESSVRVVVGNPATAANRASEIWNEAMILLVKLRAGKHPILKVEDVREDLRRKADAALEAAVVERMWQFYDPLQQGATRWGKERFLRSTDSL